MDIKKEQRKNKQGTISKEEFRSSISYDHAEILKSMASFMDIPERKHLESILLESENRFRSIFDVAEDAILILDGENDRIIDANPKASELLGYTNEEIKQVPISRIHPNEMEKMEEIWQNVNNFGIARSEDLTCTTKKNKVIPADISFSQIILAGNKYIVASVRDISESKRAEKKQREREECYRFLYAKTPVIQHSIDNNGRLLDVSDRWLEVFGYKREEVIGRKSVEFLTENSRRYAESITMPEFMKKGYVRDIPYQFVTKNGEIIDVLLSGIVEWNENGNCTRNLAILTDISERKMAEKSLKESEEKFRNLFNESRDAIYFTCREGQFLDVNQSAVQLFGYKKEEMLVLNAEELYANPSDRIRYQQEIESKGYVKDYEVKLRKRDGTELDCLITSLVRLDQGGGVLGYEGIIRDISEQKKAEEEIRVSQEQLRNLSVHLQSIREEERTEIARDIHDDLGQTLTVLGMDLEWVKKNTLSDNIKLKDKIDEMLELVGVATDTVQKISTELRPGLLDEIGLGAAMEWQISEFVKRTGIKCKFRQQLGDIEIDDDRSTAMFRIFQELLTNVLRHSKANKVNVSIKIANNSLLLKLKDNGVGSSEKKLSKKGSYGIIGMRERVLPFEGEFDIKGQKGKGVTVEVKIPLL